MTEECNMKLQIILQVLEDKNSPQDPIGRAFKYKFSLPNFSDMTKPKLQKTYKNPIYTALEWQDMLDSGQFKSKLNLQDILGFQE